MTPSPLSLSRSSPLTARHRPLCYKQLQVLEVWAVSSPASQGSLPPRFHGDFSVICFYFCFSLCLPVVAFFSFWLLFWKFAQTKERRTGVKRGAVGRQWLCSG